MSSDKKPAVSGRMMRPEPRIPGTALEDDPVGRRIIAPIRDRGAGGVAGADHLQFAPFGLALSAGFRRRLAHRPGGAAPLRGFVHGRIDRGSEPAPLSG